MIYISSFRRLATQQILALRSSKRHYRKSTIISPSPVTFRFRPSRSVEGAIPQVRPVLVSFCSALCGSLLLYYTIFNDDTQHLESALDSKPESQPAEDEPVRYKPSKAGLTSEQVDEDLRWDQTSYPLRAGSSILRHDGAGVAVSRKFTTSMVHNEIYVGDEQLVGLAVGIIKGYP